MKPNQKLVELLEKSIERARTGEIQSALVISTAARMPAVEVEATERLVMTALQESESPMRACELATSRKTSGRWIKKEKA